MLPRGFILIPIVMSITGCMTTATPGWVAELGYRSDELHPLKVGRLGFPMIQVQINDIPFDLVLDTGNMIGLSVTRRVAEKLQLPKTGAVQSLDSAGTVVGTLAVYEADSCEVFSRRWTGQRIFERPTSQTHGLVVGDGLIGPEQLLGRRVTFDYRNRLLGVSDRPTPPDAEGDRLELVPSKGLEGMIIVAGAVNGRDVLVQLDTGKSRTVVDPILVESAGLVETSRGYRIDVLRLGSCVLHIDNAKKASLKSLGQGTPEPVTVGIGSDTLSQLVWTVDYLKGVMLIHSRL